MRWDQIERRGRVFLGTLVAVVVATNAGAAWAEEPKGCDGFKWPLAREATLLQVPDRPALESGATVPFDGKAVELKLVDLAAAKLPMAPERKPRNPTARAGFARYEAPTAAGAYQLTVSQAAWIDVAQDGHFIKPTAFTGATDCPGARKSLRLTLAKSPFTVQVSGVDVPAISLVITPVP
jgi:hypothetical protein